MKSAIAAVFVTASSLLAQVLGGNVAIPAPAAQAPQARPAENPVIGAVKAAPPKPVNPLLLVATAGTGRITAGKLAEMLKGAPPVALQSARSDPKEFLEWTYLMRKLTAQAENEGIANSSPYLERLQWSRLQQLRAATFEEKAKQFAMTAAEVEKSYRDNPLPYLTMRTKILFVAEQPGKEAEAKARIERAWADLKQKKPFAAVVKQYSDYKPDGEFPPIAYDSKLPEDLRLQIAKVKPGETSPPYHVPGQGHYVFELTGVDQKPMGEIREEIRKNGSEFRFKQWLDKRREESNVNVINAEFFNSLGQLLGGSEVAAPGGQSIKPETELATINGKTMTAKDFTALMKAVPPGIRANAIRQPTEFLSQYALVSKIAEVASAEGLDKKQPWSGRIAYDRGQILMQAMVDRYMDGLRVMPADQQKVYEANRDRFAQSKIQMIYISYSLAPPPPNPDPTAPKILTEPEAKARAELVYKKLQEGADFADMVERFSEDADSRARKGEGPIVTASDPNIPDLIKKPVLAAKKGDLLAPIRLPNGYYLIRVTEGGRRSYEEVKDQIYDEIRQERFQAWFDAEKKSTNVKVLDARTFQQVVAAAGN
jgi:parvulin-like peptidyl-prolyl isomerase